MDQVALGFLGSLAAGLMTALGALPALLLHGEVPNRVMDVLYGLAAGVMLAASAFSLLVPALEAGSVQEVTAGFVLGGALIEAGDRLIPHVHPVYGEEGPPSRLRRVWLLVLAMTIHNFPEGMAVGVAFGSGELGRATALATAIGIQNVPEGLAVSAPLVREGYGGLRATVYGALTGLVEPVGGLIGALAVTRASAVLPMAMGLAAGAMIFVVSDEMIPESHRKGHERWATAGVILGFALMMFLDSAFG